MLFDLFGFRVVYNWLLLFWIMVVFPLLMFVCVVTVDCAVG